MKFSEITGTIVGTETWSQTRVNGSSTGFSYKGVGTSSGRTTSSVTNVSQLWVQADDGREVAVRTSPDKFAAREGHRVSMVLMDQKSGPAWMVAGANLSTGAQRREHGGIFGLLAFICLLFTFWIPLLGFAINPILGLIVGGLMLWGLAYLCSIGHQISTRGKAFIEKLKSVRAGERVIGQPGIQPA